MKQIFWQITLTNNLLLIHNLLVYKLELHGFKAVLYPSDADIIIGKTSLQVQNYFTVTILADNTNIFANVYIIRYTI